MGKEKSRWKVQKGETDGMDRRKWMGGIKREHEGTKKGNGLVIDSRGETVINYGIVNEEAWERGRRIQNREESKVGPPGNSFEEAKGRKRTEK
jgi:hypothetical protein